MFISSIGFQKYIYIVYYNFTSFRFYRVFFQVNTVTVCYITRANSVIEINPKELHVYFYQGRKFLYLAKKNLNIIIFASVQFTIYIMAS